MDEVCAVQKIKDWAQESEDNYNELDPDSHLDCRSFDFEDKSLLGNYQVAGVSGLMLDYWSWCPGTSEFKFRSAVSFDPIYFEMPRRRANGKVIPRAEAQRICAEAVYYAEETLEWELADECYATQVTSGALQTMFVRKMNSFVKNVGGRVTLKNNYPPIDLTIASYLLPGLGPCY